MANGERNKVGEQLDFEMVSLRICIAILTGIIALHWWGGYKIHPWRGFQMGFGRRSEEAGSKERLFPFRSSRLMLPQRLLDRLTSYLDGDDVCHRWDTPEDGEDLVRLFLEVAFHANDQNVSQEDVAMKGLGVSLFLILFIINPEVAWNFPG